MDYRFYKDQCGRPVGESWLSEGSALIKALLSFSVMVGIVILAWLCR